MISDPQTTFALGIAFTFLCGLCMGASILSFMLSAQEPAGE
jgi:hypothetical protein